MTDLYTYVASDWHGVEEASLSERSDPSQNALNEI